jgi:DNA-binding NarL/FixJ family response regulator
MIRVLLADDYPLVRKSIGRLLEEYDDIEVIGEASNGHEALEKLECCPADVVVMDVSMPTMDGIQTTQKLAELDHPPQVLIVSVHTNSTMVKYSLQQGASGYLSKDSLYGHLGAAIRSVHQGKIYLSPKVSQAMEEGPSFDRAFRRRTH